MEWLLAHHGAKQEFRAAVVDRLPLRPGSTVLDVGCGPGLWTKYFAERVGPRGMVIGLDGSSDLIEVAKMRNADLLQQGRVDFRVRDATFMEETGDLVFCSNLYGYLGDPHKAVSHHFGAVRPGGSLVARHFDLSLSAFSGVPVELQLQVLAAVARAIPERPKQMNPFLGQALPAEFLKAGVHPFEVSSDVVHLLAPLSSPAEAYLQMKGAWFADVASESLDRNTVDTWMDYFDPAAPTYVLRSSGFYFSTLEVQVIAHASGECDE